MMFNVQHLQIKATPEEYLKACQIRRPTETNLDYWGLVPKYLVARCPICGRDYQELIDTYTLRWWSRPHGGCIFRSRDRNSCCEHVLFSYAFIHLMGIMPDGTSGKELDVRNPFVAEAPHVIPPLFTESLDCQAVLHSLPICRIEGDAFVPRYVLYMMSYFAPTDQHQLLKQQFGNAQERFGFEARSWVIWPNRSAIAQGENADLWWDLEHWVKQRKLSWLEPNTADLPLKSHGDGPFPYAHIEGRRDPYEVELPPRPKPAPKPPIMVNGKLVYWKGNPEQE